jgi:hypothetical protein
LSEIKEPAPNKQIKGTVFDRTFEQRVEHRGLIAPLKIKAVEKHNKYHHIRNETIR